MKKLFFFALALLISSTAFSQDLLKGPAAKNSKIGKSSSLKFGLAFDNNPNSRKGVEAKNYKIWNKESSSIRIQTRKEINNPKGIQAKNQKVWEKELAPVESKATYIEPKAIRKKKFWWH